MEPVTQQDKLYRILSEVFGIAIEEINEDSSPDTIPRWDSMSHITLIVSLESDFGISLSPEEAMEMLSVKLIRMILKDHQVM